MMSIIARIILMSWGAILVVAASNTDNTWLALWHELYRPLQRQRVPRALVFYRSLS